MKEARYIVVEKSCCGTCVHYRQHYILDPNGKPYPLHCHTPRMKRRAPDEACPHWKPEEGQAPCAEMPEEGT